MVQTASVVVFVPTGVTPTYHIPPPQSHDQARRPSFWGQRGGTHATLPSSSRGRHDVDTFAVGVAVGLCLAMPKHGTLDLLLHSKAEVVFNLLVGLTLTWCFRLGELVQKRGSSNDVMVRPGKTRRCAPAINQATTGFCHHGVLSSHCMACSPCPPVGFLVFSS